MKVNIIFVNEITPRDNTFNDGKPFKEVTFDNVFADVRDGCLYVSFKEGEQYIYPLHTLSRVKMSRS